MTTAKGRPNPVTFGWRMPMWDPAGAKLEQWLPGVREHLAALQGSIFQTVWMSDHLVPGSTWAPPHWDTLECVTSLIHFASLYPSYRYGQIVLGNSYRPPALLAKMVSTLQALAGTRVILGLGAGWMESEYQMYGYPYPVPKVRIEQLADAVQIMRALWTESPATVVGKHLSIDQAYAEPRPTEPPLLMIGASGEQLGLRVVAKYADWWNTTAPTADDLRRKIAVLAEHCQKVGRDVADILVNWQCQVVAIAHSEAEARAQAERSALYPHSQSSAIVGSPEQVTERLQAFVDVGVRDFILRFSDFPRLDGARRFAREVAPKLAIAVGT
ncbi:MAG TPA: LLM class flavin-dependent oxidoreductase [Chloroflexota bacterium]|nr:LLM class flavin-dependent oxidoreductase [Chloroflexota bacterium]